MNNQKHQYDHRSVDHVFGKERSLVRQVFNFIPDRPCQPVLYLQKQGINHMYDETTKEHNFKYFYQNICSHKMRSFIEIHIVFQQNHQVDSQMN